MATNKTVTINGRMYDAVTGLPARPEPASKKSVPKKPEPRTQATNIHEQTQRSKTLRRSAVKKPTPVVKHPTKGRTMDIARNSKVSRFAPHPVTKKLSPKPITDTPHRPPQAHPMAERAVLRHAALAKPREKAIATGKEIKDKAITAALQNDNKSTSKKRRPLEPWKKRLLIVVLVVGALLGVAYGIYRLVPAVSVSIASAQAGVEAQYPDYVPDGFSLHHPVSYSEGEVVLSFASNSNDDTYTIRQTESSWDSTAVLDNIVKKTVGDNYVTTRERGLTIYSYDRSATWVNGGVLYTITSNAHLSNEQIRRIATSL
ncbi:DUF4367 domain-containing protein [Candidatus Saccharibacteria bacterium]|nr:DUF4367 domain-containing protein [Candidatus Saccharibacteria bacterium]NCS83016.1 DUF4367 domain-containing protein [Candidatus Saccharibacteria bacterium]